MSTPESQTFKPSYAQRERLLRDAEGDTPLARQPADEVRFIEATAHYFNPTRSADVDQLRADRDLQQYLADLDADITQGIAAADHVAVRTIPVVEFDAQTHTYTRNGQRLPSVTQILKAVLPSPFHIDEWYLQRGTATHLACELLDHGRLDWSSVDAEILPRVKAYDAWIAKHAGNIIAIEKPLASREFGYAGTLDRMLGFAGGCRMLADLKNSYYPQCRLQLGAYSLLWQENYDQQVNAALIVELKEDGKAREHWLDSKELREAERQWLAVREVFEFASIHNLYQKGKHGNADADQAE